MIKRYIFLLLLFLNSCNQNGCIAPITNTDLATSNRTQTFQETVRADGNYTNQICQHDSLQPESNYCGQWLNSGIYVNSGDKIKIQTEGKIYYCMDPWVFSSSTTSSSYNGQTFSSSSLTVNPKVTYKLNSLSYNWNVSGIANIDGASRNLTVQAGDQLTVSISPPSSPEGNNVQNADLSGNKWSEWNNYTKSGVTVPIYSSNSACGSPPSFPCWYTYGQTLKGYIGTINNINIVPGTTNTIDLDLSNSGTNSRNSQVNVDSSGNNSFTFSSISSGTFALGLLDSGNSAKDYSDNLGGYTVNVEAYKCPATDGASGVSGFGNLLAVISMNQPTDTSNALSNINGDNTASASGTIWLKVNDSFQGDNIGNYNVTITGIFNNSGGLYSSAVGIIISLVEDKIISSAVAIVKNFPTVKTYVKILQTMLILYIIFYSIGFTVGLTEISQEDLVYRIIKMAIVFAFMDPNSWQFFYDNFYRLFGVVDQTIDQNEGFNGKGSIYYLIDVMTGGDGSNENPFTSVDVGMRVMFLDPNAFWRIFSLLFTSPVGIFYFLGVCYAALIFLKVVLEITIKFIMSFIYVAIMLILAPIFIPCFLFSMTKPIFDNWLQYMGRYLLEPIFLIVGLKLIMDMMIIAVANIFNDAICWKCVFWFKLSGVLGLIPGIDLSTLPDSIDNLFCLEFFQPWGFDNYGSGFSPAWYLLRKFPYIIFLMIIVKALDSYRGFIDRLLGQITGTVQQAIADKQGRSDLTDRIFNSISDNIKKPFGLDEKSRKRRDFDQKVRAEKLLSQKDSSKSTNMEQTNLPTLNDDEDKKLDFQPKGGSDNSTTVRKAASTSPSNETAPATNSTGVPEQAPETKSSVPDSKRSELKVPDESK